MDGIHTLEINRAREMVARTVRARQPAAGRVPAPPRAAQLPQEASFKQPADTISISIPSKNHAIHMKDSCGNPQCESCGAVVIPAPMATFPILQTPSISVGSWDIYTTKSPILSSDEIDELQLKLGLPIPEMIFGNNKVLIRNDERNWSISFNCVNALAKVDNKGVNLLKVSYSNEWFSTRETNTDEMKGIVKPFDWTYSTDYRGDVEGLQLVKDESARIPIDKLKQPDPILFFDEMVLYEDELGDNGISVISCKIRVMPKRMLLLMRFFLRVDNVIFRVRDTRLFIEFAENKVIREYKEQEASYADVMKKISPLASDPRSFLRDQNWIASKLPVLKHEVESVSL